MAELDEPRSRRDRPAKPPLSRTVIVDAALALVRRDRLEAVTLRSVADRLDTGPASLYVYVANRDDLLERMLDRVLSEVPPVAVKKARWRQGLVELLTATLEALSRYPGIAQVALGSIPTRPSTLAITENALALLRAGGVAEQVAAWASHALLLFTFATAVEHAIKRGREPTAPHGRSPTTDAGDAARTCFASLPPERYPNITNMAGMLTRGDDSQRFTFGLTALIAGARNH